MSEYRRAFLAGGCYFFTVVTHERRPWLTGESAIERLRQAFRRVMEDRPFAIEAIVILPDHLHCIWQLPKGDNDFPERWRQIKRFVSVGMKSPLNARREKTLWQRRYWEHLLRNEEDWRHHMDYIHYNPVKHGYSKRPVDWPYSSFRQAVARGWYEASWGEQEPAAIAGMGFE
ncbi:MAG: REP-associated tyrosine transposase [Gallionellaceae bacterium]